MRAVVSARQRSDDDHGIFGLVNDYDDDHEDFDDHDDDRDIMGF